MRRRRIAALTGAAALLGLAGAPWATSPVSAADLVYVTTPGAVATTFTPPVLVIRAGDNVTYANADIAPHDVVATVKGPDAPWCAAEGFEPGKCPLFWTPTITVGQTTPIIGLDRVKPGDQIPFICTLHANMDGTLVVLPA